MGFGLVMIIIKYRIRIQQGTIFLVVKKVIALDAKIGRVLFGPLVIHGHLCRLKNLAGRAFPVTGPELKRMERVVCLILHILWVDQSHVPYHHDMLAVTLHDKKNTV